MKSFQFAIASVVDANTGFGLSPLAGSRGDTGESATTATISGGPRRSLAQKFIDYLERIRSAITVARIVLRKRRALKRSLRGLSHLDDRMLEDIGFNRGDIMAAELGQIDLAQLQAQRVKNRENKRNRSINGTEIVGNPETGSALNEALFARAKCA